MGPVDILVLNASIELPEDFRAVTREHFDRQIAVNLRTTMELLQTLVPRWQNAAGPGRDNRQCAAGTSASAMFVYAGTKAAQLNWR